MEYSFPVVNVLITKLSAGTLPRINVSFYFPIIINMHQ